MTLRKSVSDNEIVKTGIEWDNINKKICRSNSRLSYIFSILCLQGHVYKTF